MNPEIWQSCLQHLKGSLSSSEFSTWIHPLLAETDPSGLTLFAPNAIIRDRVSSHYHACIEDALRASGGDGFFIRVEVVGAPALAPLPARSAGTAATGMNGSSAAVSEAKAALKGVKANAVSAEVPIGRDTPLRMSGASAAVQRSGTAPPLGAGRTAPAGMNGRPAKAPLNGYAPAARRVGAALPPRQTTERALAPEFTFENFVQGPSNRQAFSYAKQIAKADSRMNSSHSPLVIYGGVGLGKTHLMHAAGNELRRSQPDMNIVYCCAEDFVNSMTNSLRMSGMPEFKRYYRSAQVLLIDDIQFFADKKTSQEELLHTIDTLQQRGQKIIITCDRQPQEMEGLHARLCSRFGRGLTIVIDPPDLETRTAILKHKAAAMKLELPEDCALFIAQKLRSNVRELEGALNRVSASAGFYERPINLGLVQEALADMLVAHNRQVRIKDIKIKVAEYFNMQVSLLHARTRVRNVVRARQVAMALARELTSESLPSIGYTFGRRDHTTVMHACKKIKELRCKNQEIERAYSTLHRQLTT